MIKGNPARSYSALYSERTALLALGAAAPDAVLCQASVSTTKRTLKPATQAAVEMFVKTGIDVSADAPDGYVENLERAKAGRPLRNKVDRELGY